jgi:type IX secretion system PorP/SprF family membrane protein
MKNKFTLFIALLLFGSSLSYSQQDKHFSMFTENMTYLNPAAAGFFKEQLQLFTNFRNQWLTVSDNPYRTISASVDWRMLDEDGTGAGSFMGAGINFYNDAAGVSNYTTNVITFPISYALQVGEGDHLAFGLQPAFYQRSLKGDNLTWDNQWTGVEFNQEIASNELLLSQNLSISRFDIAAGAYWDKRINKWSRFNLGLSGQHLTKQRVNILNDDSKLFRKLTLHGQGEFKMSGTNVTLKPAFVTFIQGPNKELTFGTAFDFDLKGASQHTGYFNNVHLNLGSYFRVGDALIAQAILETYTFSVGAAYDLNVSRLNVASKGIGAMEFFLKYRITFKNKGLARPTIQ